MDKKKEDTTKRNLDHEHAKVQKPNCAFNFHEILGVVLLIYDFLIHAYLRNV